MSQSYDIPELMRQQALQKYDPYKGQRVVTKKHLWRALLLSNMVWFASLCLAFAAITTVVNWYLTQRTLKTAEMEHSRLLETEINRLAKLHSYSTSQTMTLAEDIQSVLDTSKGYRRDFIEAMLPHALRLQALYRIPASATLGMSIYESAYGSSDLARQHNNYFGIKAFRDWSGKRVDMPTVDLGQRTRANFRVYDSMAEGIRGYAEFLRKRSRYQEAFQHYQGESFVSTVAAAGYCPDSDYADTVAKIIRRHNLQVLDLPPEQPILAMGSLYEKSQPGLVTWPRLDTADLLKPVPGDSVMSRPVERQIVSAR